MAPQVGVQSQIELNSSPTVPGAVTKVSTWSWIWFVVAVAIVFGFHIRVFGHPVPPSASFP